MQLLFDIGNTNITVALYHNGAFTSQWRIFTQVEKTEDEYEIVLRSFFDYKKIDLQNIQAVFISSVVPRLTHPFLNLSRSLFSQEALLVHPDLYSLLPIKLTYAKNQVGSDLVCDAVAAWTRFGRACVTVDFGTALTFTMIDQTGTLVGVAIAPGLNTAMKALNSNTAQLPFAPLEAPQSVVGKTTVHALQAGVVIGCQCMVEGMVQRIKRELGQETRFIATGGLSRVFAQFETIFDAYDADLTLTGLRLIGEAALKKSHET